MPGRSRARALIGALAVLAACIAGVILAYVAVTNIASPEALKSRLETLLGSRVGITEVRLRPLSVEAQVQGFTLEENTAIESMALRFDPGALLRGRWRLRGADLVGPTWSLPASSEEVEPFITGALLPFWLAGLTDGAVTLESGRLTAGGGSKSVADDIRGAISRSEMPRPAPGGLSPSEDAAGAGVFPGGLFDVRLEGLAECLGKFSLESSYYISDAADSLAVENLRLTLPRLDLHGKGGGALWPEPWMDLELSTGQYCGGSLKFSARVEGRGLEPGLAGTAEIRDADAEALLKEWSGAQLVLGGVLDAEVSLAGVESGWWEGDPVSLVKGGHVRLEGARLDPSGPLGTVISAGMSAGEMEVKSASGHFEISQGDVFIHSLQVFMEESIWRGSGLVKKDGVLTGSLRGWVPGRILSGGNSAVTLIVGMLSDREGRVPVAFRLGGFLDEPSVRFDLDGFAEEAARAGVPQAKSLLKAMSPEDRERLSLSIEELLRKSGDR